MQKNITKAIRTIKLPLELNDGFGSYICEYGHVHNYSKFDFEAIEREIADPNTKRYNNLKEMWADIYAESEFNPTQQINRRGRACPSRNHTKKCQHLI